MKTLFVSFAALIFIIFVGCQSSITDPVETQNPLLTAEQENYTAKDIVSVWPGTIKLDGILCNPVSNTCNTVITGLLRYNIIPVRAGNHPPTAYKVGLFINAKLTNGSTDPTGPWTVFGRTEDLVYFIPSNGEIYILEKEFTVNNPMNWKYKLALGFRVSTKDIKLVSMELKKSGGWEHLAPLY